MAAFAELAGPDAAGGDGEGEDTFEEVVVHRAEELGEGEGEEAFGEKAGLGGHDCGRVAAWRRWGGGKMWLRLEASLADFWSIDLIVDGSVRGRMIWACLGKGSCLVIRWGGPSTVRSMLRKVLLRGF